ncbi:MAG: hypothetical protein ACC726_16605 [Chloroflexota bacterium]
MSDADPTVTTADTHEDSDAGHSHDAASDPLGPVGSRAWGAAILGGGVALLVALVLFAATQA